jgi:single-strand DNA-binding protein
MSGVNKAILVGHLGKDPEIGTTRAGGKVAQFSLATSKHWRDKASGERKERTEWHQIVVFNEGLVTVAEKFLKKGAKVYIEGEIATRKWTGQDGADKYRTEIVLAAFGGQIVMLDRAERAPAPDENAYGPAAEGAGPANADMDDEIPF